MVARVDFAAVVLGEIAQHPFPVRCQHGQEPFDVRGGTLDPLPGLVPLLGVDAQPGQADVDGCQHRPTATDREQPGQRVEVSGVVPGGFGVVAGDAEVVAAAEQRVEHVVVEADQLGKQVGIRPDADGAGAGVELLGEPPPCGVGVDHVGSQSTVRSARTGSW